MARWTCALRGSASVVRRRPRHHHSERRLSARVAQLARERDLLTDEGLSHLIMCAKHRKDLERLLLHSAAGPAVIDPNVPPVPSDSSSSDSSSEPDIAVPPSITAAQNLMMAAFLVFGSATQLPIPAVTLPRSVSLPASTDTRPLSATPPTCAPVRHLSFRDFNRTLHPHAKVVKHHHEPRHPRSLSGQMLEERRQARRDRQFWRSPRAEREAISFQWQWMRMQRCERVPPKHWQKAQGSAISEGQ